MDEYINREVFIIVGAEEDEITDIFVTDNRITLDDNLAQLDPSIDDGTRVFHGVLTLAEYLPDSFKGRSAYIVVESADDPSKGVVVEGAETPAELAREIEAVLSSTTPLLFGNIDIDSIYVLYGYQVGLCIAVNEDDIDEETIFACEQIADEVTEVENVSSAKT
jgi:hypothetical protein